MVNALYYGDNLTILREHIGSESVDLVYLDPPFNSQATYNILFKAPGGHAAESQIEAFEDTWHWGDASEQAFHEVLTSGNTQAADLLRAMRGFLGENDMMAYLAMMAVRLIELHRVLKPTGSLYLHCDPTASHYLKLLLDGVFRPFGFRNEIIWKRTTAHSNVYRNFGDVTDTMFFYSKSDNYSWNQGYRQLSEHDRGKAFPHIDSDGRRWRSENMRNPGIRPNLTYPYKASNGITYQPHPNGWTISVDKMRKLDREGRLHFPKSSNGRLRLKFYADESAGIKLQNLWDDVSAIGSQAQERLGYPTQKPLALLERIVNASSNEGDVVLDPFCGCGTAVHAAEKLKRKWIGIDITSLAIGLIERRLKDAFPDVLYEVFGTPKDFWDARNLAAADKYQFQWWAVTLVEAQPVGGKKKGADRGIDGVFYFQVAKGKTERGVVSVKGGDNVSVAMIRDLAGVMEREKAPMGLFITLAEPTKPMETEAAAAGVLETPFGTFPRLQIATIADLLEGKRPRVPPLDPATFRKAKRETREEQRKLNL
ncbi:MAG: DNA methyltransferase [Alphaproteobacteria bacterium]